MAKTTKSSSKLQKLHSRNKHAAGYNIKLLCAKHSELKPYVFVNDFGSETIDFSDAKAIFHLNKALLIADYKVKNWEIAKNSLCPAIPGRADYIHYIADLLATDYNGTIPTGSGIHILDIGVGSSLIYPLIGTQEYGWKFTGSEIDPASLTQAELNINSNSWLKKIVALRVQDDPKKILKGVVLPKDKFNAVMCNPPFYASREENWKSATKKSDNLYKNKATVTVQNFGGHPNELWCEGGEQAFISKLIYESMEFKSQLGWITSLVASKEHVKPLVAILEYHKAAKVEIIPMKQGQKTSRLLAWKWQ